MEKYIKDERTWLEYELIGDYYFIAGDEEPEREPIGIWEQRHFRYFKQYKRIFYMNLLTTGKLYDYLTDLDKEAEEMFSLLVEQIARKEGLSEKLKAENQMEWVGRMNSIRNSAREVVNKELIYL